MADTKTTMSCPSCEGRGTIAAFVERESGGHYDPTLTCSRCLGIGVVSAEVSAWIKIGTAHRLWRVAQRESIMECADRLGIQPAYLSGMEHGRSDPAMLIEHTPECARCDL